MKESSPLPIAKNWPELFKEIQIRPELWIGHRSIVALTAFVLGIRYSEHFSTKKLGGFDWEKFEKSVCDTYNKRRYSLDSLFLAHHLEPDPIEAFNLWFDWYEQFTG